MTECADHPFSRRARHMRASEIRELLKLIDRPGMVSFAGGIPDMGLCDMDAFGEAHRQALQHPGALQYSTSEGYLPLRRWIASYMTARGVPCTDEHILITHGSQQALDLIGKLFLDPGDRVATAMPTYLGALQSFSTYEPEFIPIHFQDGMALADAQVAKLLYLVPDFANPTGYTLDMTERHAALELARRLGAIVVEDAAYTNLRYEGSDLLPIAALDRAEVGSIEDARTLYCGTFSKTLSPGLRVGWICGPADLIRRLTLAKQAADLHTATINQQVTHHVALSCFDRQVERARGLYARRRDTMLAALDAHAPAGVSWTRPEGGLFIWVTLPATIDANELLRQALVHGVAFVPGAPFFADGGGANTLRLSFSLVEEDAANKGIGLLCDLIANREQAEMDGGRGAALRVAAVG